MEQNKKRHLPLKKSVLIKRFLMFFAPLAAVLSIVVANIYYADLQNQKKILANHEQDVLDWAINKVTTNLGSVVGDLMFLADHSELQDMLAKNGRPSEALLNDFLSFSRRMKKYDQIRFLNETGREVIRVNYNNGNPEVVPQNKLQSQAKRNYFGKAYGLEPGVMYVSPLDLNIEGGQIEQPLKPTVRLGTPVFDRQGRKRGVVLLDYFGDEIIRDLEVISNQSWESIMLLNPESYWLKGPKPSEEWGFMFEDRQARTFARAFPEAWQQISTAESGQFFSEGGFFTFVIINPFLGPQISTGGGDKEFITGGTPLVTEESYWKIVAYFPPSILNSLLSKTRQLLTPYSLALGIILVFMAAFLAYNSTLRQQAREKAERLARETDIMAEVGRIIGSTLNIEEVYWRFAQEGRKFIEFDRISINIINPKDNMVTVPYIWGVALPGRQPGESFPLTT